MGLEKYLKSKTALLVLLGYAALVAYASLSPSAGSSIGEYDKVAHLLTYTVFTLLGTRLQLSVPTYLLLCGIIIGYGGAMEFGQSFVPGRDMSAADMLANFIGVLAGMALHFFWRRRRLGATEP